MKATRRNLFALAASMAAGAAHAMGGSMVPTPARTPTRGLVVAVGVSAVAMHVDVTLNGGPAGVVVMAQEGDDGHVVRYVTDAAQRIRLNRATFDGVQLETVRGRVAIAPMKKRPRVGGHRLGRTARPAGMKHTGKPLASWNAMQAAVASTVPHSHDDLMRAILHTNQQPKPLPTRNNFTTSGTGEVIHNQHMLVRAYIGRGVGVESLRARKR
jgi:hypothetical protein